MNCLHRGQFTVSPKIRVPKGQQWHMMDGALKSNPPPVLVLLHSASFHVLSLSGRSGAAALWPSTLQIPLHTAPLLSSQDLRVAEASASATHLRSNNDTTFHFYTQHLKLSLLVKQPVTPPGWLKDPLIQAWPFFSAEITRPFPAFSQRCSLISHRNAE